MLSKILKFGVPPCVQEVVPGPSIWYYSDFSEMNIQLHAIMWQTITRDINVNRRSLIFLIKFTLFADGLIFLFLCILNKSIELTHASTRDNFVSFYNFPILKILANLL
jgi:hypothetical protein